MKRANPTGVSPNRKTTLKRIFSTMAFALVFGATTLNCSSTDPQFEDTLESESGISNSTATKQLVELMAEQGKVFVFDKDKTLLGGDTSKTKRLLQMIKSAGANMAILTSNSKKIGGQYKAITQLQSKFGTSIFPDSFFQTGAFQVNDDDMAPTKANEMEDIIDYYGVEAKDVVFYDDKQKNISDVTKKYEVVAIKVDPTDAMTESDFRKGMFEVLDASKSCSTRCSSACPCDEGEGDCDRDSDCSTGLFCDQQSGKDFCRDENGGGSGGSGGSNLQLKLGGGWKGVCCNDGELEVSTGKCTWEEHGRVLETRDLRTGRGTALRCPENGQRPKDCDCHDPGERMHGIKASGSVHVKNSLSQPNGAPIFPNSGHETCVDLVGGELQSRWTTSNCPAWRLVNFY